MLGVDYASVDGNAPPDFAKAFTAGVRVVGIRKCQHLRGRTINDACFPRDAQHARDAGMTVIPYFFPGMSIHDLTPKAQVAALKASPGDIIPKQDLPIALDIEGGAAGWKSTGHSIPEIVALLEQTVRELEDQFGCRPSIYTSYNQWYDLGLPKAPWIADCLLWVKTAYRLAAGKPVDAVIPPTPHTGVTAQDPRNYYRIPDPWSRTGWFLQQFQGDATGFPGFDKRVDVNRLNELRPGADDALVGWVRRKVDKALPGAEAGGDSPTSPSVYDAALEASVRALQSGAGLTPDGVIGAKTLALLGWL